MRRGKRSLVSEERFQSARKRENPTERNADVSVQESKCVGLHRSTQRNRLNLYPKGGLVSTAARPASGDRMKKPTGASRARFYVPPEHTEDSYGSEDFYLFQPAHLNERQC